MAGHESRLFVRCMVIGVSVTLTVLSLSAVGILDSLEFWLYDQRAALCQIAAPPPTTQLAHLDIDDPSLEAIGRWPWPRATQARILEEVQRAGPSAIGLDILFSELEKPTLIEDAHGKISKTDDDAQLAKVLATSGNAILGDLFRLESADAKSPLLSSITNWFIEDLELSSDDIGRKINQKVLLTLDDAGLEDLLIRARRAAMLARIDRELDKGPATREQLVARLLPHSDPAVHSVLIRVLETQYAVSRAAHGIDRFGAPLPPLPLPPVHGTLDTVPAPIFSAAAADVAFTNYDIFDNATVRSIPLFVEYKNRLYPQIGLAIACVMLKADPRQVRFENSHVIIPAPGREISIPTYNYHSKTLGAEVPFIAAVPWFGTKDWETMYDWPAHKTNTAHVSIANVWEICSQVDRLKTNCLNIDKAISHILDNDRADKLAVDAVLGKQYSSLNLDPQDSEEREIWVDRTLARLKSYGLLDSFQGVADKDLTDVDRLVRDNLYDARDSLINLVPQNRELRKLINSQRKLLETQLRGKGILVGFIASGLQDRVGTSLHLHCPGVVVHGVIANAVLTGRWWRMAPPWTAVALTILLGMATAFAQGKLTPVRGTLVAIALVVGYLLINGLLVFNWGQVILGVASPTVTIIAAWAACTLDREILEGIERNRIATEVALFSREMELARRVQLALIPTSAPKVGGLEVDGWALAADRTGGDCYDFWQLHDGRLAILLADASGHGLAPAMIVSQVRTLVRTLSDFESHPHGLLARVNSRVSEDLEGNRFVTAFLAFLDHEGKIQWASAGHGPMYWCPTRDGNMQTLVSTGLPLGIQSDWLADEPGPPLQLEKGGILSVFSDGMFEAPAPDGEQFGVDRVKEILSKNCGQPCAQIIEQLRNAVQKWQQKIEPVDDQTVVIVRRL
jgi:CHASE2 domain-containing sensor protein